MITGIIGVQRGGTSAVAGVVYHLGMQMWGEDTTLDDNDLYHNPEIIKQRTGDWAYKHTRMWQECDTSFTDQYIFVFRDAVASSLHGHNDVNIDRLFFRHNIYSTYKTEKPCLYVSYEKLLLHTEQTVQSIADFLGKEVTQQAIEVINPNKGYFDIKTGL